jgi:hypothetical protein
MAYFNGIVFAANIRPFRREHALSITKRFPGFLVLSVFIGVMLLAGGGCGGSGGSLSDFAGGQGTPEDPYQIATAEQLGNVRDYLDANFVLTNDIDLASDASGHLSANLVSANGADFASSENWKPIGAFVPISDKPEDGETPNLDLAFTGVFDGGGYKISNVSIDAPEGTGVGLFGCIAGDSASISNLTVENVNVAGMMLVGGIVGYGANGEVKNVKLVGNDNNIEASSSIEGGMVGMVGGIVGGGFCDIIDCDAQANVKMVVVSGQLSQCVGVLVGGMEDCDITGSSARGSVTVEGNYIAGIGGLAGCAMESQNVRNCESDVVMTIAGENNMLIGGLLGYSGISEAGKQTLISDCTASAVINSPNNAERIGGIVGGGFFMRAYTSYFPIPSAIRVTNCKTSGEINGGNIAGTIIGYAYSNSSVDASCASDMTIKGSSANQIGANESDVPLSNLL